MYDALQADSGGSNDINGPVSGRKQKCVGKLETSPNDAYYAAVTDTGDLCIYIGKSPYFGGTRDESGHRPLHWCFSHDLGSLKFNQIIQQIPKQHKDNLYLHVLNDGSFGMAYSTVSSHDIMDPVGRVSSFHGYVQL